jgi:hypothetical protein
VRLNGRARPPQAERGYLLPQPSALRGSFSWFVVPGGGVGTMLGPTTEVLI